MNGLDLTALTKKYGSGYVAKSKKTGRVVAHAKRIDLLFKKASLKCEGDLIISWVPKRGARYVFRISI